MHASTQLGSQRFGPFVQGATWNIARSNTGHGSPRKYKSKLSNKIFQPETKFPRQYVHARIVFRVDTGRFSRLDRPPWITRELLVALEINSDKGRIIPRVASAAAIEVATLPFYRQSKVNLRFLNRTIRPAIQTFAQQKRQSFFE